MTNGDDYFGPWAGVEVPVIVKLRIRTKRCESYEDDLVAIRALDEARREAVRMAAGAPYSAKMHGPGWQVEWVESKAENGNV